MKLWALKKAVGCKRGVWTLEMRLLTLTQRL